MQTWRKEGKRKGLSNPAKLPLLSLLLPLPPPLSHFFNSQSARVLLRAHARKKKKSTLGEQRRRGHGVEKCLPVRVSALASAPSSHSFSVLPSLIVFS